MPPFPRRRQRGAWCCRSRCQQSPGGGGAERDLAIADGFQSVNSCLDACGDSGQTVFPAFAPRGCAPSSLCWPCLTSSPWPSALRTSAPPSPAHPRSWGSGPPCCSCRRLSGLAISLPFPQGSAFFLWQTSRFLPTLLRSVFRPRLSASAMASSVAASTNPAPSFRPPPASESPRPPVPAVASACPLIVLGWLLASAISPRSDASSPHAARLDPGCCLSSESPCRSSRTRSESAPTSQNLSR